MRRLILRPLLYGLLILAVAFAAGSPARAVQPAEMLSDPVLEQRARALSAGLRCMVCQNESIDESHAPLARDLRLLVRERIVAGDSDEQVIEFLVSRYGNFVLLKPPLETSTLLLWFTPFAIVIIGGIAALVTINRRRTRKQPVDALSATEQARLEEVLKR
jgi:cytochrome c-type biogenesis protein CcmH